MLHMPRRFACFFWICWIGLTGCCAAELGVLASQTPLLLERAMVVVDLPELPPRPAVDVSLPYNWDTAVGAVDGQARFTLHFNCADTAAPQALYILRLGNTFTMTLNGIVIAHLGANDPYEDYSKEPRLYPIPEGVLQPQNTLEITIHAQGGRHAGLTPVQFGAAAQLQAVYHQDYRWRITGALVIAVVSAVFGALALILWLRQRNPLYILYGLGELLWALQVSDTWTTRSPLPWPWWGAVILSAYALAPVLISKFALEVVNAHRGWLKRVSSWQLALSVPVVLLAVLGGMPWLWTVLQGLIVLLALTVGIVVVVKGVRSASLERWALAIAVILAVSAGVRDFIVIKLGSSYGSVSLARYAWVVFSVTLAWIIAEQMRKDSRALAQMNQNLAQQLAAREAELRVVFERERSNEKTRGILEERTRLMRDMHDGLGSQLVGVLQLAQNPTSSRTIVAAQLQDALDHLKLTVDAMQETDGDVGSLLGALRYRLAPRLEAAGIVLSWNVDHLPLVPAWTVQRSRDLQMILFEAFSNLIAHSGATCAHLCAQCINDVATGNPIVQVTLEDNGSGFDADNLSEPHGRGLANMRARAANLGAVLHFRSSAAGSLMCVTLPLRDTVPESIG